MYRLCWRGGTDAQVEVLFVVINTTSVAPAFGWYFNLLFLTFVRFKEVHFRVDFTGSAFKRAPTNFTVAPI